MICRFIFVNGVPAIDKIGFNNFIDGNMGDLIEFNAQPLRNFEANFENISSFIKEHIDYKIIMATDYPERVK